MQKNWGGGHGELPPLRMSGYATVYVLSSILHELVSYSYNSLARDSM